jgi:hypothetical protein
MPITRGLKAIQDPQGKSRVRCDCRHLSPDKIFRNKLFNQFMTKSNPLSDFVQFIIGGCFFAAGVFLLSNQVMVRAPMAIGGAVRSGYGGGWGAGFAFPWGSPGMGLLLLPLGIGLCMAFAGVYERWSKLLIWASLSALLLGVLNSIRMSFVPTTLWQLGVYIAMIGIGGGLMFKGLKGSGENEHQSQQQPGPDNSGVLKELAELRDKVDRMDDN